MTQDELTYISIPNVPVPLKEKLEKLADKDKRKLSAYLRIVLENHVQAIEADIEQMQAEAAQAA